MYFYAKSQIVNNAQKNYEQEQEHGIQKKKAKQPNIFAMALVLLQCFISKGLCGIICPNHADIYKKIPYYHKTCLEKKIIGAKRTLPAVDTMTK